MKERSLAGGDHEGSTDALSMFSLFISYTDVAVSLLYTSIHLFGLEYPYIVLRSPRHLVCSILFFLAF
jgi:hypothetical protein